MQVEQTRKQLREVRRNLSKDIDLLANQINILNTFLISYPFDNLNVYNSKAIRY